MFFLMGMVANIVVIKELSLWRGLQMISGRSWWFFLTCWTKVFFTKRIGMWIHPAFQFTELLSLQNSGIKPITDSFRFCAGKVLLGSAKGH
jgi:hypothetical protein